MATRPEAANVARFGVQSKGPRTASGRSCEQLHTVALPEYESFLENVSSRSPAGEKQFNRFMDLAVKLSSTLSLDLVNDKLEELSTQWLKEVRSYVVARQDEMQKVGIEPGGSLAARLFS